MGARVAAFMALEYPDRVATLIFGGLGSGLVEGVGDWDPIADALVAEDPATITHPRGKMFRSPDGGQTWERLLGGLPNGQRATFGALTIETWDGGFGLYAADTDGQVFESLDGGDSWCIVADVAAVSKGEFHRGLRKDRVPLAVVDDVTFHAAAEARLGAVEV